MGLAVTLVGLVATVLAQQSAGWTAIAPGMELRWVVVNSPSPVGDGRIAVLRVDPLTWQLDLVSRSQTGDTTGRTAREWAQSRGLAVAINAGMFEQDYETHTGYMECRGHVNSSHIITKYKSVVAFDPRHPEKQPLFRIFDLDVPDVTIHSICEDYASVVQNLRLVKRPGVNRWEQQDKRWSEAALGEDKEGKVLFVMSRSPLSMHDLNAELLAAGIGLVALQHLEGGPEAQLYVHVGDFELEIFGSYETSFREDDDNAMAWPIPNVLGIRRKVVLE